MVSSDSSGDQYADIARALNNEPGVVATLERATATAQSIVDNCDHAGIALVLKRGEIRTVAPTDDVVARADQLQYDVAEGPCLQSIAEQETVYSSNLLTDERWPLWALKASDELGVRSVLSLQLFVGPDALGALNLYSRTPDAFGVDDRLSALALASHIAVAMSAAQELADIESALARRTVIGQAEGMLMQALAITADQAFSALIRISQARQIKLYQVAADIVENGVRPSLLD